MPEITVYEQPLNERIRAFLRLEYLFARASNGVNGSSIWDSRATLDAIIDIMAVLGRADLKKELIKELERQSATLEALKRNPGVNMERLASILGVLKEILNALRSSDNSPESSLRQNEMLGYVRQRSSIPAGTCSFDIPAFQHWLEQPAEARIQELQSWLGVFDLIQEAIKLCLNLIRDSADSTVEMANKGFFQHSLEATSTCQMIRVVVPSNSPWFPEISGGRHRFTVRFLEQSATDSRPIQTNSNIEFELQCCMI